MRTVGYIVFNLISLFISLVDEPAHVLYGFSIWVNVGSKVGYRQNVIHKLRYCLNIKCDIDVRLVSRYLCGQLLIQPIRGLFMLLTPVGN